MRTIIVGLFACLIGTAPLRAEPYPDRPVTIVVPFGKGTTADLIAAVVADAVSKNIGQKVIVELKPGAGGGIAMEQVEKAAPDGYSLGMITQGTHVFNLSLYKTLRYDPQKIMPITPIAAVSNVMTVHPSNPANTPLEVAAAAKAAPGQLTYASGGVGTSHHLGGVLFASLTGVDIKHVPHLVSVDGVKKIVNGEITMGFFNLPTVIDDIKAGKLKALAVTSPARSPHLPDVPTLDASGLKGYDLVTWFGFGAPAGTPPEIVQRLRDEFAKAAAEPEVKAKLKEAGLDPIDQMQPADFSRLIAADLAKWTPIIKAAGAGAE
jgi:tripartite-type tricarboxylate transporter receptor subunit TctC